MQKFLASLGEVELTKERERHIFQFHPEVKFYRGYFQRAIAKPDKTRRSAFASNVVILYGFLASAKKYLAIVIKTNKRNFILTAYLTHRIKHNLA